MGGNQNGGENIGSDDVRAEIRQRKLRYTPWNGIVIGDSASATQRISGWTGKVGDVVVNRFSLRQCFASLDTPSSRSCVHHHCGAMDHTDQNRIKPIESTFLNDLLL